MKISGTAVEVHRGYKVIVYGDILFLENFIIGGALIYITAEIFGEGFSGAGKKAVFFAGCLMCGLFSMTVFIGIKPLTKVILELLFASLLCFIVFGRKKLCKKIITFILVTYFMGGITMAILFITRNPGIHTGTGIYTGDMKACLLAVSAAVFLFTAKQVIKTVSGQKFIAENIFNVQISSYGKIMETKGFLDTGNGLKDPVSAKPVAIADGELWRQLEEGGFIKDESICIIPYASVGTKGIMMAFRCDYIKLWAGSEPERSDSGRIIKGCIIAKNDSEFKFGKYAAEAKCRILLSKDMKKCNL